MEELKKNNESQVDDSVNLRSPSPSLEEADKRSRKAECSVVGGASDSPHTSNNLRTDGQSEVGRGLPPNDNIIRKSNISSSASPKEKKETVSVILVTYNTASSIEETLASVFSQDCNNFELILIDNGSEDTTYKKMRIAAGEYVASKRKGKVAYGPDTERLRLVNSFVHMNLEDAMALGLSFASGTRKLFWDGADMMQPGYLTNLLHAAG